ncbi:ATP-binding protein [Clostridium tertium]|uniref:ATP-binding protein n=1 Tax=Clostridium tertium TaxID=1559 RepID=A0A9X3XPV5_9CLOT|nr:ATP-binding protein [Clostridium tertium]MDC4241979.1 ATP-binding protein [Clostridium tertium]
MSTITNNFNLIMGPRTITDALGSKIIELDSIVISELIKNSKDAHAKKVTINFSDYKNSITIWDNGDGMSIEEIKDKWGVVASNNKANAVDTLGGKGIGRFSIFKLCNSFTIITKKEHSNEYKFTFDIKDLYNHKSAEDYTISIIENSVPEIFKTESSKGTYIIMNQMNEINLDEIYSNTQNLILHNSDTNKNIDIEYIYPSEFKKSSPLSPEVAIKSAPFQCSVTFEGANILNYDFKVSLNDKIVYTSKDYSSIKKEFSKLDSNLSLGKINFTLSSFYFDLSFVKHYKIDKKYLEENFLNYFCGVSVYRKDFKIYGLGENDWLGLTERRVDQPSKRVNNKQIYAYLTLESPDSDPLEEKTSREGFIRSKYLDYLKEALIIIIRKFEKDHLLFRPQLYNKNEDIGLFDNELDNGNKGTSEKDTPSGTSEKDTPSGTSEKDTPSGTSEKDTPSGTSEKDTPSGTSEKDTPSGTSEKDTPSGTSGNEKKTPPTPKFNKNIIIDSSFTPSEKAPEKIKRIIFELQKLNSFYINSQALLLRCLIDTSTQYFAEGNNSININTNDLKGSVLNVLNHFSNSGILDKKICDRIRSSIKKDSIINYFNGVAHYYNYRPDFDTIKSIWDTFEPYIEKCISK